MSPHPLRCQTCKNVDCPLFKNRWNRSEHKFIWEFGCASHSSTVSGRDKVLNEQKWLIETIEELIKFCVSSGQYKGCNILTIDYITHRIEQLRQQHKERTMTASNPQRCEHECVCFGKQVRSNFKCPLDAGIWKKCMHDTRNASHSDYQGVADQFISLIIEEMVYDDGDMYYKVNPEKYVDLLNKLGIEGEI